MSFEFSVDLKRDTTHVKNTLCSELFFQQMASRFGGQVESFTKSGTEQNPLINTTLLVPAENFPSQVKRFVPDPLPLSLHIQFAGQETTVELKPARLPADAEARVSLSDQDGGSQAQGQGDVNCTIPFIGNRVVSQGEELLPKLLRKVFRTIDKWDGVPS